MKEAIDELKMNLRICKARTFGYGSMGCLKRVGIRTYAACQPQCRPPYIRIAVTSKSFLFHFLISIPPLSWFVQKTVCKIATMTFDNVKNTQNSARIYGDVGRNKTMQFPAFVLT
jgi:hypothetical protein